MNKHSEGRNNAAPGVIYFFSCDGSFSVFFYACASRSYDAFFFYHKAYQNNFLNLVIKYVYLKSLQRLFFEFVDSIPYRGFDLFGWYQANAFLVPFDSKLFVSGSFL